MPRLAFAQPCLPRDGVWGKEQGVRDDCKVWIDDTLNEYSIVIHGGWYTSIQCLPSVPFLPVYPSPPKQIKFSTTSYMCLQTRDERAKDLTQGPQIPNFTRVSISLAHPVHHYSSQFTRPDPNQPARPASFLPSPIDYQMNDFSVKSTLNALQINHHKRGVFELPFNPKRHAPIF